MTRPDGPIHAPRPPIIRQIGRGTGEGTGMVSWRDQHIGETVICCDCGAETPRVSWRTKRCQICQPVYDKATKNKRYRRRAKRRMAA